MRKTLEEKIKNLEVINPKLVRGIRKRVQEIRRDEWASVEDIAAFETRNYVGAALLKKGGSSGTWMDGHYLHGGRGRYSNVDLVYTPKQNKEKINYINAPDTAEGVGNVTKIKLLRTLEDEREIMEPIIKGRETSGEGMSTTLKSVDSHVYKDDYQRDRVTILADRVSRTLADPDTYFPNVWRFSLKKEELIYSFNPRWRLPRF